MSNWGTMGMIAKESFKELQEINKDVVCAIDSYEGEGKTTCGIELGQMIQDDFDLKRNISYLPHTEEIEKKFLALREKETFMVDEAAKGMYKQFWAEAAQKRLNQLFMTRRKDKKITILCIPRFNDLGEYFRNHRVKFRIHIIERGIAGFYVKDDDKDVKDPWHILDNQNLKKRLYDIPVAERTTEEKMKYESATPNFVFFFKFPALPVKVEEEYLSNVKEAHELEDEMEKAQKEIGKREGLVSGRLTAALNLLEKKGVSQKEICRELDMPQSSTSQYMHRKSQSISKDIPVYPSIVVPNSLERFSAPNKEDLTK